MLIFSDERRPVQPPDQVHRRLYRPPQHLHRDRVLSPGKPAGEIPQAQQLAGGAATGDDWQAK